jgi:hypothetical protein
MDENGYIVKEEVWEEVEDEQQVKGSATATSALNPKPKPSENKDTEKTKPASKPAVLYFPLSDPVSAPGLPSGVLN